MKTLLAPSFAVALCTILATWGCHLAGMPRQDLWIAAVVTFTVSAAAALAAVLVAGSRRGPRSDKAAK